VPTFGELEAVRKDFIALVRSCPSELLTRRPSSDDWSILENARHLLYAEQLHFRPIVGRVEWSPIGVPTGGKPKRNAAGTESTDDLDEVLATWDRVHQATRRAVKAASSEDLERPVDRNLRHLRAHTRTVARLIKRATEAS